MLVPVLRDSHLHISWPDVVKGNLPGGFVACHYLFCAFVYGHLFVLNVLNFLVNVLFCYCTGFWLSAPVQLAAWKDSCLNYCDALSGMQNNACSY